MGRDPVAVEGKPFEWQMAATVSIAGEGVSMPVSPDGFDLLDRRRS